MTHPPLTRAELDRLEQLKTARDTAHSLMMFSVCTERRRREFEQSYEQSESDYLLALRDAAPQLLALARQALEQQERDIDDKFRAQTEDY